MFKSQSSSHQDDIEGIGEHACTATTNYQTAKSSRRFNSEVESEGSGAEDRGGQILTRGKE